MVVVAKILFECADEDKALWVESAASERLSLSAWIRRTLAERVGDGSLGERGQPAAAVSAEPEPGHSVSSPRSPSNRDFTPDFKKPKPEGKK